MTSSSARKALQEQVRTVIAAHQQRSVAPPFADAELLAMALICSSESMSVSDIVKWLCNNFEYYNQLAVTTFSTFKFSEAYGLSDRMKATTRLLELPLSVETADFQRAKYRISSSVARQVLREALGIQQPEATKPFRFFDLPPELRNKVYEFVLRYPKSGLFFRASDTRRPETMTRRLDKIPKARFNWNACLDLLQAPSVAEILSPLRTNKQMHSESLPLFYKINHFVVGDPHSVAGLLSHVPRNHRRHIEHVTLAYDARFDSPASRWNSAALVLANLESLRKFELRVDQITWEERSERHIITKRYTDVRKIPGITALKKLRGLEEVVFHGCPKLEELLKADMTRPKRAPTGGKSKKRKADPVGGDDNGEATSGGKRKKTEGN